MKIYNSIEVLPIWNYYKCITEKDLNFLIEEEDKFILKAKKDKLLNDVWSAIDEQMTALNLKDESFVEDLKDAQEYELLKLEQILKPSALNNIFLQDKENQLKELNKDNKKDFDFYGVLAHMIKFMGVPIDSKKISVIEYYANIALMKKSIKKPVTNGN